MDRKIFGAFLFCGILFFSGPGATQEENDATVEGSEDAAPEDRRGFFWEPGFTYQPGFPTERRSQEEFGISPEFEEEVAPPDGVTDSVPEETFPEEELGVPPEFNGEPLPPTQQRGTAPGDDAWRTDPDSRIDPSDPLGPERTIQR